MKFLILFTSIYSALVSAMLCNPSTSEGEGLENAFTKFVREFNEANHFAANSKQVENSACSNKKIPTVSEIDESFSEPQGKVLSKEIFGMQLEDSIENLELLRQLLKIDKRTIAARQMLYQPSYKLENCKKVLCAAKSIFGEREGSKVLYALKKYGLNMSHLRTMEVVAWSEEEIDNNLDAINDLPEHMFPLIEGKTFAKSSKDLTNEIANQSISFYVKFREMEKPMQRYTVVHELGHLFAQRGAMVPDEWLEFGGWKNPSGNNKELTHSDWSCKHTDKAVSGYSLANPAEDFAESFAAYRYNPKLLKKLSPKKYEYLKNYAFMGVEYTSESKCKGKNQLLDKVKAPVKNMEINQFGRCEFAVLGLIQKELNLEKLKRCYKSTMALNLVKNELVSLPENIDKERLAHSVEQLGAGVLGKNFKEPTTSELQDFSRQLLASIKQEFIDINDGKKCDPFKFGKPAESFFRKRLGGSRFENQKPFDQTLKDTISINEFSTFNKLTQDVCKAAGESEMNEKNEGLNRYFEALVPKFQ